MPMPDHELEEASKEREATLDRLQAERQALKDRPPPDAETLELAGEAPPPGQKEAVEGLKNGDTSAMLHQLLGNQRQLQDLIEKQGAQLEEQQARNETLMNELNESRGRREAGLQTYDASGLSEDEKWKRMHSEGGLLG